jgi:hypothetical protein
MNAELILDGRSPSPLKRFLCSLPVIVLAAFLVRLLIYLPVIISIYKAVVIDFQFGAETGAVAAAIAQGRGFSSPLRMVQTGPTGWFAPVFPYLLAGIFKLFGVYSYESNLVITFFDIAFSAFTCWPIAAIGTRSFNKTTGTAAAWAWVFLAYGGIFSGCLGLGHFARCPLARHARRGHTAITRLGPDRFVAGIRRPLVCRSDDQSRAPRRPAAAGSVGHLAVTPPRVPCPSLGYAGRACIRSRSCTLDDSQLRGLSQVHSVALEFRPRTLARQ